MGTDPGAILVFGNVTLDIICKTVDDVPRYDSISFREAAVTAGGCASNVAINLAQMGERPFLVACLGMDQIADFLLDTWGKVGVDTKYITRIPAAGTGVSVGLVDSQFQPRFIHTSAANAELKPEMLKPEIFHDGRIRFMHIAGYFVLPGLLDPGFAQTLAWIRERGVYISLDVVRSPAMKEPELLWGLLPNLDAFMCNQGEAEIISGISDPAAAAKRFREKGARSVIIKMGAEGCWLAADEVDMHIPGNPVDEVVDTTGAGDAFAAGFVSAMKKGAGLEEACRAGINQGAGTVRFLGAIKLD